MKFITICIFLISSTLVYAENYRALSLERKQAFTNIEDNLDLIIENSEVDDLNWNDLELISQDLNDDIRFLKQSFPPNSFKNTRARERIWSNLDDFKQRFSELENTVSNISESVKNKNQRNIIENWDAAGNTCNACHRRYRTFW
jgi:cytochrome c556